jgi:hypothetical protein
MNVDFVTEHEKLRQNVNAFWGPDSAPFSYTTSKWGRESSCEVSSDSDDSSYQTPPMVEGSSGLVHSQEVQSSRRDGEKTLLRRSTPSLSSLRSQPRVPHSGGTTLTLKRRDRRGRKGLVKASWTHSSKDLEEIGSIGSSKRKVRSLSPLEYASDVPEEEREGSLEYSKWVSTDYFAQMQKWMSNVDLGKPPSDEEQARARFGIGWSDEGERAEAEAILELEDDEVANLVDTHRRRAPRR